MRGSIISYIAAQKRNTIRKQLTLERTIQDLENKFRTIQSKDNLKNLEAARSALIQLLTSKAETSIFFARQRLYKHGNKPGHLLVRLTKGRNATNLISLLKDNIGETVYEFKRINKIMRQFYQNLYSAECNMSDDLRKTFLDQTTLPSLTEEQMWTARYFQKC